MVNLVEVKEGSVDHPQKLGMVSKLPNHHLIHNVEIDISTDQHVV